MAFDETRPADNEFLADFPAGMREQLRALIEDQLVNAMRVMGLSPGNASGNIPISNGTVCTNLNADKLDGNDASAFATSGHGHGTATTSSNGFMSNTDKAKLDGIAAGAEVNQNAFANVKVGTTTIQADAKQDTIEFAAGSNIAITPDATNDKVTIAATGLAPTAHAANASTYGYGDTTNAGHLRVGNGLGVSSGTVYVDVGDGVILSGTSPNQKLVTDVGTGLTMEGTSPNKKIAVSFGTTSTTVSAGNHGHTKSQITDFPTSMPANGGNSATVGGYSPASAGTASTVAIRDGSADLVARLHRTEYATTTGANCNYILTQNAVGSGADNYARPTPLATLKSALGVPADFDGGHSFATNGYQKFGSGLIIQWGLITAKAAPLTVTFPIAFPNALRIVVLGCLNTVSSGGNDTSLSIIYSPTKTSYQIWNSHWATNYQEYWIAIGY